MKAISAALKAHLAQETTTLATLWLATRADGQVFAFTDHDCDLTYNGIVYQAGTAGYTPSSIKTTSEMNVDNMEVIGALNSSSITDDDLLAGKWDFAEIEISLVNYMDLSMGAMVLRRGWLGEMKTGRSSFTAELRGMTQPLQQRIGRIYSAACDADLGDARCQVNMVAYTVTGSVETVLDQHSFVDPTRTETNSTTVKSITNITRANPCVVTCPSHGFSGGQSVTIANVLGMTQINGYTGALTYIDANNFSLPLDTSSTAGYSAYSGGGTATLAADSEYFQGGKLTWTSGQNAGLSMEVKSYRPNYIFLAQPMLYAIAPGDTYSLTAGCDKLRSTCVSRFNNVINFRGFPDVPGMDRMISGT